MSRHLLLLGVLLACDAPPPDAPELEVLMDCKAIHGSNPSSLRSEDTVCVFDDEVRLWVRGARPEVRVDGRPIEPEHVEAIDDGHHLRVRPATGSSNLTLSRDGRRWARPLRTPRAVPLLDELGSERTQENLDRIERERSSDERERAALLSRAGRIALSLGQDELAVERLTAGRDAHRDVGEWTEAIHDAVAAAWVLHRRLWRPDDAEEALRSVASLESAAVLPGARVRYRLARVLAEHGDLLGANQALSSVIEVARRLDVVSVSTQAVTKRADILHRTGRSAEARELLQTLEERVSGCDRADVLSARGWLELIDDAESSAAETLVLAAEDSYRECGAHDEHRANAAVNVALAAFARGDLAEAEAALDRARSAGGDGVVRAWDLELSARMALAENAERALRSYDELARRASLAGALSDQWRAQLGRGRALLALRRIDDAEGAFRAAESVLARESELLALGSAPSVAGRRWSSASELAGLLLARGRADEALAALRSARLRTLARRPVGNIDDEVRELTRARLALEGDASVAWELPLDELADLERSRARRLEHLQRALDAVRGQRLEPRPMSDGELLVVVFPHEDGRIVVQTNGRTTTGAVVGPNDWPDLDLTNVSYVRLVGAGAHTFSAPAVSVPVLHSLDVSSPAARRPGRGALVIVDPGGNLREARAEGAHVARHLDATTLAGESATFAEVIGSLQRVEHLHYAGHARPGDALRSSVRLADQALTAADVLTLDRVPSTVVLNGCESARASGLVPVGVAQSFVLAGSRLVVGAIEPVDDALSLRLARRLTEAGDPDAVSWAEAVADLGPSPFRVFVP